MAHSAPVYLHSCLTGRVLNSCNPEDGNGLTISGMSASGGGVITGTSQSVG